MTLMNAVTLMNTELWPEGACVRKFYEKRGSSASTVQLPATEENAIMTNGNAQEVVVHA